MKAVAGCDRNLLESHCALRPIAQKLRIGGIGILIPPSLMPCPGSCQRECGYHAVQKILPGTAGEGRPADRRFPWNLRPFPRRVRWQEGGHHESQYDIVAPADAGRRCSHLRRSHGARRRTRGLHRSGRAIDNEQSLVDELALHRRMKAAMQQLAAGHGLRSGRGCRASGNERQRLCGTRRYPSEAGDFGDSGEVDHGVPLEVLAVFCEKANIDIAMVWYDEMTLRERRSTRAFVDAALAEAPDDPDQRHAYLVRLGTALREQSSSRLHPSESVGVLACSRCIRGRGSGV
jgi:hypothetical protein